jgi:hypothetical protein
VARPLPQPLNAEQRACRWAYVTEASVIGCAFIQPVSRQPNDHAAGGTGGTGAAVAAGLLTIEASCKADDTGASAANSQAGALRLCGAAGVESPADPFCASLADLMFPDPDDRPAGGSQPAVRVSVTLDVPLDLAAPPRRIVPRPGDVVRASMPEASVDEDGDFQPSKHHVGLPIQAGDRRAIRRETESSLSKHLL